MAYELFKKNTFMVVAGIEYGASSTTAALLHIMHITPVPVQVLFGFSFAFRAVFLLRLVGLLNRLSKH